MKKLLLNSTIVLSGILLGAVIGGYVTFAIYSQQYIVVRAFAWMQIGLAVSQNEFDSNSSDAKQALSNTLYLFDRNSESPNIDAGIKNALRMNRGMLEAQLFILEKEAGDTPESASYLLKSQNDLKTVGWLDVSEDNILRTFKRGPVPPCGAAPGSEQKASASTPKKPCG